MRKRICRWSRITALNRDPDVPLRNRAADNWRSLIAIADACGGDWGARAREAATIMSRGLPEEEPSVLLLSHIRAVYDARGIDRLFSGELVHALLAMDDAPRSEWRGIHEDRQPRRLSQGELARMLAPFDIRPRSIWAAGAYCGADGGPAPHHLRV